MNRVQIQKIRDEDEIVNTNYTGKEEMNTQRTNITSNLDKESVSAFVLLLLTTEWVLFNYVLIYLRLTLNEKKYRED